VEGYELPLEIRGELRPYQRAGIAWLAFLRRCGLHGCLADDMGLGKTLQATAIVAGEGSLLFMVFVVQMVCIFCVCLWCLWCLWSTPLLMVQRQVAVPWLCGHASLRLHAMHDGWTGKHEPLAQTVQRSAHALQ
jgi:hypothetical protein